MLEKCQRFKPSWAQGVAFFSSTEFWQFQIQAEPRSDGRKGRYNGKYMFTGKKTEDIKPFEHLLLTCHCSDTLDPYFFFPTSLKVDGRNASNGIALCVREYRCKEPYENQEKCRGRLKFFFTILFLENHA
uniref:Uncharacterized protein n=1 Tax=Panagrolaimus sp. PS1159 TaxID=55785 RepID=A0AC35F9L6_9BILA